ncbi:hypothetical protein IID19_05535 [Patescibacteria group bacterium]|nr:hypothetical protein [Patescibacteria group bacterium]
MDIIREFVPEKKLCVIRTLTGDHSLQYFKELFAEAQKDFPNLKDEDVKIVHYRGGKRLDYRVSTRGIEFTIDSETAPDGYTEAPFIDRPV